MPPRSITHDLLGLAAWLGVTFIAAAIGAFASINARSFYTELTQPAWAPPGWVFSPVWTTLYILMAIAAWLVWRTAGGFQAARVPLTLYLVQLAFNALWSWLFFAWHLGALAFVEVVLLFALILATLLAFWQIRPLAGVLLVPYLLWVGFASVLTYAVWRLNPQSLS